METDILKTFSTNKAKKYEKYLDSFQDKNGEAFYMCFDKYQLEKNNANPLLIFLHFWLKYLRGTNYGLAKAGIGYNPKHQSYQRETIMFWVSGLTEEKEKDMAYKYENTHEGLFPCQKYFGKMILVDIPPFFYGREVEFFEFSAEARKASLPTLLLWDNKNIYEYDSRMILIENKFSS